MSWFSDLAGKAESILNNLDEQTGAALRNHNVVKKKGDNPGAGSPDPPWERLGRRRPIPRNLAKKIAPIPDNRSVSSTGRKPSPHRQPIEQSPVAKLNPDLSRNGSVKSKKSPSRKPSTNYNLNHPPKTLVDDIKDKKTQDHDVMDHVKCKQRRRSLPADLELLNNDEWAYKTQNLEVENELLKNELTVMNGEMTQAMDRLRRMEDGNHVDRTDAAKTRVKLETADLLNEKANVENQTLSSQINQLKQKLDDITNNELRVYKDEATTLQVQVDILKDRNSDLEQRCKEHLDTIEEKNTAQIKLENELRHSQSTISDLQNNLRKATDECRRLERDWEAYKLRVKNMLVAKDNEIKALQEGLHHTEDTKVLLEQIGNLKDERDELSDTIATIRGECIDMKSYVEQAEAKQAAAERVVAALRDALRDERAARNKAEAQYLTASKELKHFQIETGQTITSLRTALRDKDTELHHFRESSASRTSNCNSSALNVADYDNHETIENNKIQHLTQTLVQRQTKLDSLLAENNILKIQLEKLDSKYKTEISSLRANYSHSVVNLQDGDCRPRSRVYAPTSSMSALSLRIGVMMKRYPVIRIFCITYMVCLHFWVLTVLFTSTPDNFSSRPVKS